MDNTMIADTKPNAAEKALSNWITSFVESQADYWNNFIDPRDAYLGPDGEVWQSIGAGSATFDEEPPYRTEADLKQMRAVGRLLWKENEFAQNAHENRISYIIGWGHQYNVTGIHAEVPQAVIDKVTGIIDRFHKLNRWGQRQAESLMRFDRDGESFIRIFKAEDGFLRLRFVEPGNIGDPGKHEAEFDDSFGIRTPKEDIETVLSYWVKNRDGAGGDWIDSCEIQHRKANVDSGLKRGIPLLWPVRKNLSRAFKLLRNMSTATEIQTAIALIRRHAQATGTAVRSFIAGAKAGQTTDASGQTRSVFQYGPGSIIDAPNGTDYTFPSQGLDPSKTVAALDAELRAIAARLVMPEFMLTSNAANANYASTMVAEGPAVKKFERDQQTQVEYDLELIEKQLEFSVSLGALSPEERAMIQIDVEPPTVTSRDRLKEAQAREIDMRIGILSPQTATAESSRDYETEQANIESHQEKSGNVVSNRDSDLPPIPGLDPGNTPAIDQPSSLQATALNGAQIASLSAVATQVATGQIPSEAGKILLRNAFPMIPETEIDNLIRSMQKP